MTESNVEFENLIERKNYFYRDQYRRLVGLLIFLLFTTLGLLGVFFILLWGESSPKYYATTTTGVVVPIQSLSSPVVTQDYVLQWSELVARTAMSLSFDKYQEQLKNASQYFTQDGWASYQAALKSSGLLDSVQQNKLIVSSVINGAPVVVNRYISHGHYTWEIQMPLLVLFSSASMNKKTQYYVNLTIKRVPELEVARGISVTNFSVR